MKMRNLVFLCTHANGASKSEKPKQLGNVDQLCCFFCFIIVKFGGFSFGTARLMVKLNGADGSLCGIFHF